MAHDLKLYVSIQKIQNPFSQVFLSPSQISVTKSNRHGTVRLGCTLVSGGSVCRDGGRDECVLSCSCGLRWGGLLKERLRERRYEPSLFHTLSCGSLDRLLPRVKRSPGLQLPSESASCSEGRHTARNAASPASVSDKPRTIIMVNAGSWSPEE